MAHRTACTIIALGLILSACGEPNPPTGNALAETPAPDHLDPDLRARVSELVTGVQREATSRQTAAERIDTLWSWANARARSGRSIAPELPVTVSKSVARLARLERASTAPVGQHPATSARRLLDALQRFLRPGREFKAIDQMVRDTHFRDAQPDGLGRLSSSTPGPFVAHAYSTIDQTWTVGSQAMSPGGYLVIAEHFMSNQGKYQTADPTADNYVNMRCSNPDVEFEVDRRQMSGPHGGFFGPKSLLIFRLRRGRVGPGDSVTITYGDRRAGSRGFQVQAVSNDAYQLPLYVSFDGRSPPQLIDLQPFEVIGAEAAGVHGFAPSVVQTGEVFALAVRTEDRFFNRASGAIPAYDVFVDGRPYGRIPPGRDALTVMPDIRFDAPGVYRFSFVAEGGVISGHSNPVWVQDAPPYRIFWGDMHGHSGFAEGQGSVDGYFRFGRDDARLDFLSLTEHDLYLDDREWADMQAAVQRYSEEGRFITYLGFEYTANHPMGGHHNVLFRTPAGRLRVPVQTHPYLRGLYQGLLDNNAVDDVLVIPHAHNPGDWRIHDPALERLVEILSIHGSFEWFGRMYLQQGYRVGLVAASDDHLGHPGYLSIVPQGFSHRRGLTAVLAHEKSTDAIFSALRNLSAYATTIERIILDVNVNGTRMGGLTPPRATRIVKGQAMGSTALDTIDVIKNGALLCSFDYAGRSALPESGNAFLEVNFTSASDSFEQRHDPPRGTRFWKGALHVEGATVVNVTSDSYNPLRPSLTRDAAVPNHIGFRLQTRGDTIGLMLELTDIRPDARIEVEHIGGHEWGTPPPRLRPPARLPAEKFSLALADLRNGKLVHALPVDYYTDEVSLRVVEAAPPLDQSFECADTSPPLPGAYYIVRVKQRDGGVAWSSPVWIDDASKLTPATAE